MVLKITLPPEGYFVRSLVISELLGLNEVGINIEGDIATIEKTEEFKEKLKYELEQFKFVLNKLKRYVKNYGNQVKLAEKVFSGDIEEFFKKDNNNANEYFLPLIFPEIMEAEKWFGGWSGSGKGSKRTIGISKQSFILSLLGLGKYQLVNYRVGKEQVTVLATVDTTIMSDMCKPSKRKEIKIKNNIIDKLSHISRLLIFSIALDEQGCQEILLLKEGEHRAEIYEKNPHASLRPLIRFWALVNDGQVEDRVTNLANDSPDSFNKVSNYIFDGIRGTLSSAEVSFMIAKETYLKEENSPLTSWDIFKIREALRALREEMKEVYSST
ncbi:CRISPR-associated protein [Sulfolobus sp. E5-1-F]|uniref:CRISPR-associated protein n=1 Tax=Saccharolobus sp. E5-1-F TaxID=2663019 RepID=UPI0012963CB3|nr:CRISPR-associated protein [Sulfolobus sp. E5-1-F]QGA53970.1 CRISPR-associated protein [Sulfolobus sp. E5-1-F]